MFCRNCGHELDPRSFVCPYCGASQDREPPLSDSGSFGWGLLGFFVPLVGLILYLVWHDTKPRCAHVAGKGALISVILQVVLSVLAFLVPLLFGTALLFAL